MQQRVSQGGDSIPYNLPHVSSRTIAGDRSTGIHPGHTWIGASDNCKSATTQEAGKVWRTPTRNPLMTDHNSTQNPSVYEVPIVASQNTFAIHPLSTISSTNCRWSKEPNGGTSHTVNCTCTTTPASAASMSTAYETNNTNTQKRTYVQILDCMEIIDDTFLRRAIDLVHTSTLMILCWSLKVVKGDGRKGWLLTRIPG